MKKEGIRLNKFLASCAVGSRRKCDLLIQQGEISVNGKVCKDLSTLVSEDDYVKKGGHRLLPKQSQTILFHKPKGFVCSKSDELSRDTIYELLPPNLKHLNHIGRLDKDSSGILLLTNDGELAQSIAHPKQKVEKEYLVTVNKSFGNEVLDQFLKGVWIDGTKAQATAIKRLSPRRFMIILETGLKRQIRMMCKALHLQVIKLVRIRVGLVTLDNLSEGQFVFFNPSDYEMLSMNPDKANKKAYHTLQTVKTKLKDKKIKPKKSGAPQARNAKKSTSKSNYKRRRS